MYNKWIKHIVSGNCYFGLEIHGSDGEESYSLLKVEQQKGELEVALELTTDKIEEVLGHLDKNSPLFLALNTSQVLNKQVTGEAQGNHELLVVNAFPNLELDHFYYQVHSNEDMGLVAIGKKAYVDGYLQRLRKLEVSVFSVALGAVPMEHLAGYLEGAIEGSNFMVEFRDGRPANLSSASETGDRAYDINGLSLDKEQLLSFSHILGHLKGASPISNLRNKNIQLSNEFKNMRVFDVGLKAAIGFFLVLLLANFLLFNHYSKENEELQSSLASNALQDKSLRQLKERIATKEEKLKVLAGSRHSRTTFYLDELGKDLPHSIWLAKMEYQPLLVPVRENKPIETRKDNLQVSGITNDKVAFAVWSDNLETQKWVEKIKIIDYEYISNSSANFTVNIVLHETVQ
ncbi:MAG: hypothetical protein CMH48_09880 [Muricauda sp.]|nr:hypothetical protein [Allomuricauda sp.]MBC31143.1 hypothetical protein [Allomuricauda sp.]|tara:strand:- start:44802 stop:46010 length:1209 start_codon:yes stop_codon:yes gene_type:complete